MNSLLIPHWCQATLWGLISGSALLIGAVIGFYFKLNKKFIALVMAFGAGVLISAISLELMSEAFKTGGTVAASVGFVIGGVMYSAANWWLASKGAHHRKRSGDQQVSEEDLNGSGTAIAIGALLDGIPESIVLGLSLVFGKGVSIATLCAIFISNIPEGLSSSAGMKRAGRSRTFIFGLWTIIMLISGASSLIGYTVFQSLSQEFIGATTALAAGAILTMLVDTMIPEAFEGAEKLSGLVTLLGFLLSFWLSHIS
jgi:ZIP family zinc transporter